MPNNFNQLAKNRAEHMGETYGGLVIDTDGENPVVNAADDIPNIIVNGEDADDYVEGDTINAIQITDVKDTYMFGKKIKTDEERQKEDADNYMVTFQMFGHKFTSATLSSEDAAHDLKEFLKDKIQKDVEVQRTR